MKVRMAVQISGTRSGVDWPPPGEPLETDSEEAAQLCRAGLAVPMVDDTVETAVPPKAEERAAEPKPVEQKPAEEKPAEEKPAPTKRTRT